MKLLLIFAATGILIAADGNVEVYKTKFDNIDTDAIIKNERLLKNHFKCLLENTGCTPEAEDLKTYIPEIMETCCAKCSDKHKDAAKKMAKFLMEKNPEVLTKLMTKYDPDKKYREKCAQQLKDGGLDLSKF